MNLSLLLIPTLAGYWLLVRSNPTRYWMVRQSGYVLFFSSAIAGIALLAVARMLAVVCDGCFPDAEFWWANSYAPFDYSGTISLSALLALAIPVAINRFLGREIAAKKAAKANGDLIECVIQNSLDEGTLVELTMNNCKSYIGFARESGVAVQGESDAALIPLASGYRDKDTRELEITTEYASVIERRIESDALPNVSFDDFQVVLPTREIASARHFDVGAYELFRK